MPRDDEDPQADLAGVQLVKAEAILDEIEEKHQGMSTILLEVARIRVQIAKVRVAEHLARHVCLDSMDETDDDDDDDDERN